MNDFAQELFASTLAEPYRTKVVEKLRLPGRAEREEGELGALLGVVLRIVVDPVLNSVDSLFSHYLFL